MKIKMLQSIPGALNGGLDVHLFKKGLVYPNKDIEDLEGLDEIFLENKFAEPYVTPEEVLRHQKGLSGAPENKREVVPENKRVIFLAEELEGAKAGDIRKLAKKHGVDLTGALRNTSAETLISMYLERQDN